MTTEKTAVTEFFKPKFQKMGLCVKKGIIYSNQIRIYVSSNFVELSVIDDLRAILDWDLDEIWVDSGDLVFIYK